MTPEMKERLRLARERILNMTPEELYKSTYGYTEEELEQYKSDSFHLDVQKLKDYLETHDCYSVDDAFYGTCDKIEFIDEVKFSRVFSSKSTQLSNPDDWGYNESIYDGIREITISGQGSYTTYSKYVPNENDILKNIIDEDSNHIKYVARDGQENELSVSTDDSSTHVSFRHNNGLFTMSKEEFKLFRSVLNSINLNDGENDDY